MHDDTIKRSGRILIGLITILVAASPPLMANDKDGQSIEAVISQQKKEIEDLQQRVSSAEKVLTKGDALLATEKELATVKRGNQARESNLSTLKKDIASANEAITAIEKEFTDYKNQYRAFVRAKAKGRTVGHLETHKGEVFENVTIREVTPIGLQIRSDAGLVRIPYEELPDALQEEFQFDPAQKAEAIAKEAGLKKQPETVQPSDGGAAAKAASQKKAEADAAKAQTLSTIEGKKAQLKAIYNEISNLQDALTQVERRPHAHDNSIGLKKNIAARKRDYAELQAEINQLQSNL